MSIHVLNLRYDVSGEDLAEVIAFASSVAEYIGIIVGDGPVSPATRSLLDGLAPHLVETGQVNQWPGTTLTGSRTATRYLFRGDGRVAELLIRHGASIDAWQAPTLPEDIHFLRADESVVFASVTHDADAWLEVTDSEMADLHRQSPGLLDRAVRGLRDLTQSERDILEWIAREWAREDATGAAALAGQIPFLRVVDGYPSPPSLLFQSGGKPGPIHSSDGLLPFDIDVLDTHQRVIGTVNAWVGEGALTGIEVSLWDTSQEFSFGASSLRLCPRP